MARCLLLVLYVFTAALPGAAAAASSNVSCGPLGCSAAQEHILLQRHTRGSSRLQAATDHVHPAAPLLNLTAPPMPWEGPYVVVYSDAWRTGDWAAFPCCGPIAERYNNIFSLIDQRDLFGTLQNDEASSAEIGLGCEAIFYKHCPKTYDSWCAVNGRDALPGDRKGVGKYDILGMGIEDDSLSTVETFCMITTTTSTTTTATTTTTTPPTTTTTAPTTTTTTSTTSTTTTTTTTAKTTTTTTPPPTTTITTTTTPTTTIATTTPTTTTTATTTTPPTTTTTTMPTTTTTTTTTSAVESICVIWGEPHIRVFDSGAMTGSAAAAPAVVDILNVGDYWIVKSEHVSIQGRYKATQWTNGLAATSALAIGGDFLQGHSLIVESLAGNVTWDGARILDSLPSEFTVPDLVSASFHEDTNSVDPGLAQSSVRSVFLELPLGVRVTVNRWAEHIDVKITMRRQPGGQDGHCGNFNGDISDDTAELIWGRMGAEVPPEALLFPQSAAPQALRVAEQSLTPLAPLTLDNCTSDLRAKAERLCDVQGSAGNSGVVSRDSCVWDVCFGGEEYAQAGGALDHQLAVGASASLLRWAAHPNWCVDVGGGRPLNGSAVQIWECKAGHPDMLFLLPEGGKGQIRWAAYPEMCLDVARGESADGVAVQIWECQAGHRDMQFVLPSDGRGRIRWLADPERCLDVSEGDLSVGTHLQLWTCAGEGWANQEFLVGGELD